MPLEGRRPSARGSLGRGTHRLRRGGLDVRLWTPAQETDPVAETQFSCLTPACLEVLPVTDHRQPGGGLLTEQLEESVLDEVAGEEITIPDQISSAEEYQAAVEKIQADYAEKENALLQEIESLKQEIQSLRSELESK